MTIGSLHSGSRRTRYRRPVKLLALVLALWATGRASGQVSEGPGSYSRPEVGAIRSEVRDILADPRYAPRQSLWQIITEWFRERFSDWNAPHIPESLARVLWTILLVWAILALVAILAHLIWTIAVLWPRRRREEAEAGPLGDLRNRGYQDLVSAMADSAAKGDFRHAAALMMLALLQWLDARRLVRFHESKTNGDYVREYPPERASRRGLRQFVNVFDRAIYGGNVCDRATYEQMHAMFQEFHEQVRQES
ncbi:MAG: DUF4129 domain-containing protein [Phycisphaerae bacterium]|mgnify:CR=1 FL=1|nr:DUF4129 domain-containing protein [Phycisphaerae bacterium]